MQIQITITDSTSGEHLNALAALVEALGGRSPFHAHSSSVRSEDLADHVVLVADHARAAIEAPAHPMATSDQLIAEEAKRAAGEATGNTGGGAASPAAGSSPLEYDSQGVPYDERIHTGSSDNRTNQDGSWRKRRRVADETVAAVMSELSAAGLLREPAPAAPLAPAPVSAPPAPVAPVQTAAPPAPQPTPEPAATAAGPAGATSAADGAQFAGFPAFVAACSACGSPTYDKLNKIAGDLGVAKYADMKDRPELWDMFYDMLKDS